MRDNKNVVIGLLCTVLCVMSVAYAAFSTSLQISGTATVTSTWNVAIDDIECVTSKGFAEGVDIEEPKVEGKDTNLVEIGVTFNQPGDKMTCTVYIANKGTLNAKLASIVTEPKTITNGDGKITNENDKLTIDDFIHYTIGQGNNDVKVNDTLRAKSGETINKHIYTIVAEYVDVFDDKDNSVALPEGEKTRTITIQFNYVQNLT